MSDDRDSEILLNGKTYTVSARPRFGHLERVKSHMMSGRIKISGDIMREWPEGDAKDKAIKEQMKPLTDAEAGEHLNTTSGQLYFIWMCLNANHPDVSWDVFKEFPMDDIESVKDTVTSLNVPSKKKKPGRPKNADRT